jgi:ABC-type branched-subunit amino acid transport system substrate-binding protein
MKEQKHSRRKMIIAGIVLFVLIAVCALIWWRTTRVKTSEKTGLHVVILDSEEYYYSDAGIEQGINMALQTIKEDSDISITVDLQDDGGDYVNGISMAKSLAKDDSVDMVISFQNFESIGAEIPFFEEAKKPFIVTMGCYDEVAENGYQYFVADFLSGKTIGARIGEYIRSKGLQKIALCHSDTTFEKDEIKGLQSVINDLSDSRVYYSQTGPYNDTDLAQLLNQCEKMDADTVIANFYSQNDSAWLLSQLKQKAPGLTLIGDYALDSSEILEEYGENLEGVVIVPAYPYEESDTLEKFVRDYKKSTGQTFTTAAVQYYDLFCMIASCCEDKIPTGTEIMETLKSDAGYQGVAGLIRFDQNGCLQTENCPMFICHNKEFERLEETTGISETE